MFWTPDLPFLATNLRWDKIGRDAMLRVSESQSRVI
jgi:hypothetical protein